MKAQAVKANSALLGLNATLLREPEVRRRIGGYSRTSIWRWVRNGTIPLPVQIGPRGKAWREADIEERIAPRPPAKAFAEVADESEHSH